jgi:hypothetical protein
MHEIIDQAAIKINLPIIKHAVSNQKLLNKTALGKKVEKCAFYAAFRKATNSVLVAAIRCAFSSR